MTSRLRSPRSRCRPTRGPGNPARMMSCDDGAIYVEWIVPRGRARLVVETPSASQALGLIHVEPLAPLLAPVRGWDLDAPEREHLGALLAAWPYPGAWGLRAACVTYPGRANVEPEPSRQRGVAGDLGAALRDVPDRRSRVRAKREAA